MNDVDNYFKDVMEYYRSETSTVHDYELINQVLTCFSEPCLTFEKILRYEIVKALDCYIKDRSNIHVPWVFSGSIPLNRSILDDISRYRKNLNKDDMDNAYAIQSKASLDFWCKLAVNCVNDKNGNSNNRNPNYDDESSLWDEYLYKIFDEDPDFKDDGDKKGLRSRVQEDLEYIREFRNKLFHYTEFHSEKEILDYIGTIKKILDSIMPGLGDERVGEAVNKFKKFTKPSPKGNLELLEVVSMDEVEVADPNNQDSVVVVAATVAHDLYKAVSSKFNGYGIYVCPTGRYFRGDTAYMAFYSDKEIKREVPRIIDIRDNVDWNLENATSLTVSEDEVDRILGNIIKWALSEEGEEIASGWSRGKYKVFLLKLDKVDGYMLDKSIPNLNSGRGSAYTMSKRYTKLRELFDAISTDDL